MKLVMTLKVRDEEDILEANLRHHLAQGVDFVVALDNGSVDRTPEILGRYRDAGLAHVIEEPSRTFGADQGRWVTEMARLAHSRFGADWVINNDADEFWWPVTGTLTEVFAAIPDAYGALAAPRPEFLPRLEEEGDVVERLVIRERRARSIPKLAHRGAPDVVVAQGSHNVRAPGEGEGDDAGRAGARAADRPYSRAPERFAYLPVPWWPVRVLHYAFRSYDQFVRRIQRFAVDENGYPNLSRRKELREVHATGGLPGLWREIVPDEDAVEAGLREGRFVRDTSLRDFLAGCPDPLGAGGLAAAREHAARHAGAPEGEREAELADLALSIAEAQARREQRRRRRSQKRASREGRESG